ncbi:MAG: DUF4352 domain-containing protein [Coriobacteriales bacterium]|jgi:RNA polymerase subunit RPABC4/transcription elongation factor Spt4|nr:DUF4352 domain-containing protein [Coriobacteriales bacterium]
MAIGRHTRKDKWHFSDTGNRFDGKKRGPRPLRNAALPDFKRGVIRCKRCGARVVSNLDNCPFCGKPLKPVFARFWFWLIVIIIVAAATFLIVKMNLPTVPEETAQAPTVTTPQVVGGTQSTPIKGLVLGTAVTANNIETSADSVQTGPVAKDGTQLSMVTVTFMNNDSQKDTIYSTQWQCQNAAGTRFDPFVGTAADGTTITSNFETYDLQPGEKFTGRLYFKTSDLALVVFQPGALAYSEDILVTWKCS